MDHKTRLLKTVAWGLSALVICLTLVVWLQGLSGRFDNISTYQIFPLFGLMAFSLMWGHYVMSALRQLLRIDGKALARYFNVTSWVVLLTILLHPGLLAWQLWRDGFGLPPGSILEHYVAPSLRSAVILGSISLLAFLAYEFHRKYSGRSWWRWVQYASDGAMLAILYHGWRLGSHIQASWFRGVWVFYSATFVLALGYIYYLKATRLRVAQNAKSEDTIDIKGE